MSPSPAPSISLIGLPYLMGVRAPGTGYQMAAAPELLLADEEFLSRLATSGPVETVLLEGLDDPEAGDTGGDHRLLPRGDQMARQLVQNSHLAHAVRSARAAGSFPLVAGATCSSAFGVVAGTSGSEPMGLIWFDAHGDAQTPDTSANGFIEGMVVSTIAGHCWPRWRARIPGFEVIPESHIVTVGNHEAYSAGARDDPYLGQTAGRVVDPPVIARDGFERALADALDDLRSRVARVYLHIDADVLDPSELRANSHCADGGLTTAQLRHAVTAVGERFEITAINLTAWDPEVDPRGRDVLVPLLAHATEVALRSRETS